MSQTDPKGITISGRRFWWITGFYFLVTSALVLYVGQTFGYRLAAILLLILLAPLMFWIRIFRWQTSVKARDLLYLLFLLCVVVTGAGITINNWYATEVDKHHEVDVEFANFKRLIESDGSFETVFLKQSRRGLSKRNFTLSGTVKTVEDLNRLELLAGQGTIRWKMKVTVEGVESDR